MTKMKIVEEPSPSQQIDSALLELDIKARQKRKSIAYSVIIIVFLASLFFSIPYFYPQYSAIFAIDVLIILFGGVFAFIEIPKLIQPLDPEFRAFRRIAQAIDVLKKSKTDIAYEEAYRDVQRAYETLKNISLSEDITWYKATNDIFKKFLKDLELIVLPAIRKSTIKKEHLEQMALAIYSLDPLKLAEVNKTLETESDYKERTMILSGPEEGISQTILRLFRTYALLKHGVFVSLTFLGCAIFYEVVIYLDFQRDTALGVSVAAFIGLVAIYVEGTRRPAREQSGRWHDAEKPTQ
jgi:hypothetical protein